MKTLKQLCLMASLPIILNATTIHVDLDVSEKEHPVNPLIYGQFIEHMGRCIYGGIWAEMLEDRKFYFPITEEYAPYKSLLDTDFPVVGASPWQIIGSAQGVTMVHEDSFVGEHTPLIVQGSGIQQLDLALKAGLAYEGYVWLKAEGNQPAVVAVTLSGANGVVGSQSFEVGNREYDKFAFQWRSKEEADKGILSIKVLSGSCFVGTASILPGDHVRGMRADTLKLLKELNSPIYRWPGGNFVSGYNWRDGIGDRDRRPPRKNPAWTGVEPNDFGTDEFIDFCREIATEPMIAANTGFGDAYSAAQWVEYCNSLPDTIGGSWREKNGNSQAFGVKYWCVGNEMWGSWQLGFMHLDHYVLKHTRTAKAMLQIDDSLVLVASGDINSRSVGLNNKVERGWSEGLLQECASDMDMISEHFYRGRLPWTETGRVDLLTHVSLIKNNIREIAEKHRKLQAGMPHLKGRIVPIAMDEWNYWHREYNYGELGCTYELQDALGIAAGFHEYYRQSDIIQMAYYAQTVNVIGAIKTTKTNAEFAATGLVLKLYRAHYGDVPLRLETDFGSLDVAASLDDEGKTLVVSVVNPLKEEVSVSLILNGAILDGKADKWWVTGKSKTDYNTPGLPRKVDLYEAVDIEVTKGLNVPALSCTIFRMGLK